MDHIKIIKRAFSITWNYRVLWLFGFLLALTMPRGGGNGGGSGSGVQGSGGVPGGIPSGGIPSFPEITPDVYNSLIIAAILLVCFLFLLGIASTIIRYVSETALLRLVDRHEETGEKATIREGFRLGWSRKAFRLFLIDLLVGVVGILAFILLLLVSAAPLLVWLTSSEAARVLGTIVSVGLIFLVILAFILIAIVLSVVMEFIRRAAVLEDLGVIDSIRRGFALVRQRLGDVALMAIILFAVNLGLTVLMIPVIILLLIAAVVIGGLPGLLAGAITSLFAQGWAPYLVGALVGLPLFLVVLIIPGAFISGLVQIFLSSAWTLTFREVLALGKPESEAEPA